MTDERTVTLGDPPSVDVAPLVLVLSSSGNREIASRPLPAQGVVSIGRSQSCAITIDDASLSRHHATLHLPDLAIIDHGSRNGTWVVGTRIAATELVPLALSQPFRLGHVNAVIVRSGLVDRGVLAKLEAILTRATAAAIVARREPGPAPEWAHGPGISVVSQADVWLAVIACDRAEVPGRLETIHRVTGTGTAVELSLHKDGKALFVAAERDRMARASGTRSAIESAYDLANKVADSSVNVLVSGETGTGKEVLAEHIHRRSPRRSGPMIKVNCAALAAGLFESQMFGHELGAFTGAVEAREGLIAAADGGTLFLDEVGELPLEQQGKLLRVLEDRVVTRVGSASGQVVDVRFIAATNESLQTSCAAGKFREDLYFRLAGLTIELPPLRERTSELDALVDVFVRSAAEARGSHHVPMLAPAARAALLAYRWPGNIRELRNVMERAVILSDGRAIEPTHLQLPKPSPDASVSSELDADSPEGLVAALARCAGNQTRAARLLGISRNTLLARLDRFGLPRPRK